MKKVFVCFAALFLSFFFQNLYADVSLPALFCNNMVLQQDTTAMLWGWADPGEKVRISTGWGADPVNVTAGPDGKWLATVKTPKADGKPYTLTFSGKNTLTVQNVLFGEVWLCSGQSNMEFPLTKWTDHSTWATGVNNYQKEIAEANYPQIRLFTVERQIADTPQKDVKGNWQVCSPRTAADFSAVAYYFAREIYSITGFPVGLISSNWGGTPAESWTKKAVLETDADFLPILERYNQALADYSKIKDGYQQAFDQWRKEADQAKAGGQPVPSEPKKPVNPTNNKSPYQLYNAMIAPLEPFTLKGVLWYQGESNAGRAYQYRKLFPAMINNWRSDWGNPNMPFYFVQISPHRSQNPEIREAQLLTMLHVPYTGMVVTTDNGDSLNIHPRNKELVGKRLSLWALNKQYGKKDLVYSGPVYKSMKANDREIQLFFDYTDGGLLAKDGSLKEFTIAGSDHIFYPAKAEIKGNSVVVSNPAVKNPVAVRFAWKNVPEPNFYNKAGLPASPFRTDRWKGITEGKN